MRPDLSRLGPRLRDLRAEWDGKRLDSDPLLFPHRYAAPADREVVAFLAASLAFGRVASIKAALERALLALGPSPAAFLAAWDGEALPALDGFVHRWVDADDLRAFLASIARTRRKYGSLRGLLAAHDDGGPDYVAALDGFFGELRESIPPPGRAAASRGREFLLPAPSRGAACKRAHLFLRWAVRDQGHDLGLFRGSGFTPARLLLPMDTHVHRISRHLGLTSRPAPDLAAAREATAWLRALDPTDPVGYDWALSRMGILAACTREVRPELCARCPVEPVCRASLRPRARGRGSLLVSAA